MTSIAAVRTVKLLDREPGKPGTEERRVGDVLIEKGVPVPSLSRVGLKAALTALEPGESFVWPRRISSRSLAIYSGRSFTQRSVGGKFRIWRTR